MDSTLHNGSSRGPRQLGDPLPLSSIVHLKGCVEDSELPSLVEGEIRVLGSTMHPKNAAVELMQDCLAERIGLKDKPMMATLPEDIGAPEGVEPRHVGNDDKRVPLRGDLGLHHTQNTKPGFVVSAYRGYTSFSEEHNDLVFGKHPEYPKSSIEWEMMVEAYCANDEYLKTKDGAKLFVDALGYGNLAALVNDCSIHPFGPPDKGAVEGSQGQDSDKRTLDSDKVSYAGREEDYYNLGRGVQVGQETCKLLIAFIRGFPFLFLVVTREFEAPQEALMKYGYPYWELLQSSNKRLAQWHVGLAGQHAKLRSEVAQKDDELAMMNKRWLEKELGESERKQTTLHDRINELPKEPSLGPSQSQSRPRLRAKLIPGQGPGPWSSPFIMHLPVKLQPLCV
eukprot:gene1963-33376_t